MKKTSALFGALMLLCGAGYQAQAALAPQVTADAPILWYAESLLNYAEACAKLGAITQSDLDKSINLLRDRLSMPHLTISVDADGYINCRNNCAPRQWDAKCNLFHIPDDQRNLNPEIGQPPVGNPHEHFDPLTGQHTTTAAASCVNRHGGSFYPFQFQQYHNRL